MEEIAGLTAQIPDHLLIENILAGEKRRFEDLMRRYNQRLYRTGMAILNDITEVEDAMQNAYISAFEHLRNFEARASFGTWLTRIMINECLARKKKSSKAKQVFDPYPEIPIHMNTPDKLLANKELSSVLENAVGQLPDKYRVVFVLREIEDLSVKETSDILSIEESNVKTRLNRAKTMLRETLTGYLKEQVYSFHLTRCDRIVAGVFARLNIS